MSGQSATVTQNAKVKKIPTEERRRFVNPVPPEGEDGLFSQSWFPICLSSDVKEGQVIGRNFLDGRVVVYRGDDGVARVMSAYCPHISADLAVGKVVGRSLECAFHRWQYDEDGMCVKTGVGDPPPPSACLYNFPTIERLGVIFAFNGHEALWDIAKFDVPDEELAFDAFVTEDYGCDPWVFASNTPDIQHIKAVHGIKFKAEDPHQLAEWSDWGFRMRIDAVHQNDEDLSWEAGIYGTSTFFQQGTVDGWWLGVAAGFSLPRPGSHQVFLSICVRNVEEEGGKSVQERLEFGKHLLARTAEEDKPILDSIHHKVGYLTKGDTTLARYFDFLRKYPRAHPSRDFIS